MPIINDNKIKEMSGKSTQLNNDLKEGTNTLTQINSLVSNVSGIIDKFTALRGMQQNNLNQAGQFNSKLDKAVSQQMETRREKQIIIDEVKAMNILKDFIDKIPQEQKDKNLGDFLKKYDDYKDTIKTYIINYLRNCVRLE